MTEGTPQGPLAALHQALRSREDHPPRVHPARPGARRRHADHLVHPARRDRECDDRERDTGRQIGWGVAAQGAAGPPAEGMDGRTRGEGGELKLIQWQAPSMLSPHVSTGTKDYLAAQPHHRAADALPAGWHPHPEPDHRGADGRERPPCRGSEERHLQAARRGHLGRRRAADRRRRRLHLGVGRSIRRMPPSPPASTSRSSRSRSSIRRRCRSSSPSRTPTGSSRTPDRPGAPSTPSTCSTSRMARPRTTPSSSTRSAPVPTRSSPSRRTTRSSTSSTRTTASRTSRSSTGST